MFHQAVGRSPQAHQDQALRRSYRLDPRQKKRCQLAPSRHQVPKRRVADATATAYARYRRVMEFSMVYPHRLATV